MNEWCDIPYYEGLYKINLNGVVIRLNKTKRSKPFKICKPFKTRNGYWMDGVSIANLSKTYNLSTMNIRYIISNKIWKTRS